MRNEAMREIGDQLRACLYLLRVSLVRLLRSRQTLICALLLGCGSMAVVAWSLRQQRTPDEFIEQVFQAVYVSFLLPIFCLSYATAGISSDREEQTLVYVLVTSLPRPLIFLAKFAASLLLALAWACGGLTLLGWLARPAGVQALPATWNGVLWSTLAYVTLFMVFSVTFRRATIIALAYALFLEGLVGNMPGIVKRLAVSFYTRCLIYDASSRFGVGPSGPDNPELFRAISGPAAQSVLCLLSGALLLLGIYIFSVREYS